MNEAGVWGDPGRVLGTVENMSTGVVAVTANLTTVQCSVCLLTYTDKTFWAVKEMNFAPDDEESRRGWTKYRRCRSCREAGRHPDSAVL